MKNQLDKERLTLLKSFILPKYQDIPDVGLYLDQVVKYINAYFLDFPDMQMTPSMITNYVKHKIVSKVSKKTYSRNQIAHFIIIAVTKSVLSLNNISLLFKYNDDDFEKFYDSFVSLLYDYLQAIDTKIKIDNSQSMTVNVVSTVAHKMCLDTYFNNLEN